jgi:uncharacterized protein (TIGR02996 family)
VYLERPHTNNFVKVECNGPELIRRWGQIEKASRQRVQTFPTVDEAQQALQRQVFVLERKGYLAGRQNLELLAMMERTPDEPGPFLVYADWLLERQDPRGELIVSMWRGQDTESLLGAHPQLRSPWWTKHVTLQWRLGFLHSLTWQHDPTQAGPFPWALQHILRHSSAQFVRELTLERIGTANTWAVPSLLSTWQFFLENRRPLLERVILRACPQLAPLAGQVRGVVVG